MRLFSPRWYVFKIQPSRQVIAMRHLENQGFEVFIPMMKSTLRRNRRLLDVIVPLFPGYGFVRFDGSKKGWRAINATRGVSYLIAGQQSPISISDNFVDELRQIASKDGLVSFLQIMNPGDTVEFVSGPFSNQIGQLMKLDKKGRVEVLLQLFSGPCIVKSDGEKVIPAASGKSNKSQNAQAG